MAHCPMCSHDLPARLPRSCPGCAVSFSRPSLVSQLREGVLVFGLWAVFTAALLLSKPLTGHELPAFVVTAGTWACIAGACWLVWVAHCSAMRRIATLTRPELTSEPSPTSAPSACARR